jgi:drug/metabolite transporter (DMT)-like permease
VPPAGSIVALVTLGIVNTGVAYWLFYLLIDGAGAATASVITYVMPVVACSSVSGCSASGSPAAPSQD